MGRALTVLLLTTLYSCLPGIVDSPDLPLDPVAEAQSPVGEEATIEPAVEIEADSGAPQLADHRELTFSGQEYARHAHGGPPARVGHVRVRIENGADPHRLALQDLTLIRFHCRDEAWERPDEKVLDPVEFWLSSGDDSHQVSAEIDIEPDAEDLVWMITFAAEEVYQTCNSFHYRLDLTVDGEPQQLIVPLRVSRFEPLREEY
jgi:hypothetical protein